MSKEQMTRREILLGGSALAATVVLGDGRAVAQGKELIANTYGGPWEAGHRVAIATPVEKKTGAKVTFVSILAAELVARTKAAAGGKPPVDVALVDDGTLLTAIKEGIFERLVLEKIPNAARVFPKYRPSEPFGVPIAAQIMGIAYNAKKLKTPPTAWADLWKGEYKGHIGLCTPVSQLGTNALLAFARLRGGNEGRIDPGFEAVKSLLPNISAIAPSPASLQTLLERGEVDIAPLWNNNTLILKGKRTGVEFVLPKEGGIAGLSYFGLTKGANVEFALEYINQGLDTESQRVLAGAPYYLGPVVQGVAVAPELRGLLLATPEDLEKLVVLDWVKINPQRAEWINRWNREIKL